MLIGYLQQYGYGVIGYCHVVKLYGNCMWADLKYVGEGAYGVVVEAKVYIFG